VTRWWRYLSSAESDSLTHAHAQTTKTYYWHQDPRIKKAQELKTMTSANSDIQDLPLRYQVYQGRLLASFQDDAKYEHVGQDTRSQEREQYHEIQDLKAQLQDKNIAISELKKLIEKCKGKSIETNIDKPSGVRQPNGQRIPKPLVLGKPDPFSDSLKRKRFSKRKSVPKTNMLESLLKPVTTQILPQIARQAVRNTNVIKPGMYRIDTRTTQTRAPQLSQTSRNTNPCMSTSTGVTHRTSVSRPQLKSTQMKDKVMPNNSQVNLKKTEVEDQPDTTASSQQEFDLLFAPLYDEFFTAGKKNTNNQAKIQVDNAHVDDNDFYNVFSTPVREEAESSSRYVDLSNMYIFYQPRQSEHRWTKYHLLSQVCRNPMKPVQTRRQFPIDPEMCMFVLTVSIVELKNIKEAMADSTWIEAMQEELHQFDRLQVWELVDKPFGKTVI
ncbi:hypothetical protein Tco_1265963, partial [Tanacetum coccineum]